MKTNETAAPVSATKTAICNALRGWINQRPGLDYGNYGEPTSYRAEVRKISRQRADALQLLRAVELRDSITAAEIAEAFPRAFMGRLSLNIAADGSVSFNYGTGQYWCTEYRAAACAVLASVLWSDYRKNLPAPDAEKSAEGYDLYSKKSAGECMRGQARAEFGRGIASRWFN
jgi:hypothetical protein